MKCTSECFSLIAKGKLYIPMQDFWKIMSYFINLTDDQISNLTKLYKKKNLSKNIATEDGN